MAKKSAAAAETPPNPPAEGMPLFYTNPVPLDARRHEKLALKPSFGLDFTKTVNAVPVNMIEMPQICHFYPIAFSPDANATPVALVGLRDNENLFVNAKGEWEPEAYIPAYIRRYPFIFSEIPDSDQLTLCIDMNDKVTEEDGEQKFFDAEGKGTPLAQNALEFCKSYHAAAQQTVEFSKMLADSDMLVERRAEVNVLGNRRISFSGFKIIDEQKLAQLDDKTFLEWRQKGYLPFLYAHLFSGAQWQRLTRMLNERLEKETN
ncbi:MAG: sapC family protein [Micavibrio sp.]|nr:sapC family protein [Micavibrio sp.]